MSRTRLKSALWFAGIWTVLALLWALQIGAQSPAPRDWPHIFALAALNWYATGFVSIPLVLLVRKRPQRASSLAATFVLYAFAVAAAGVVRIVLFTALHNVFFGTSYQIAEQISQTFFPQFFGLTIVVAVVMAVRNQEISNELALARLEALQAQLHPHFLFNALNSISALMHRDVERADEMLAQLSDLLRTTLHRSDELQIPLGEEVTILERYVSIMEMRFPGRLALEIDVPADLRDIRVPPLLLQPLVENAIKHGIDESGRRTEIVVAARREQGRLELRVSDNGRGLCDGVPPFGIGLENTRKRLETLYGMQAKLVLAGGTSTGTHVRMAIPLGGKR